MGNYHMWDPCLPGGAHYCHDDMSPGCCSKLKEPCPGIRTELALALHKPQLAMHFDLVSMLCVLRPPLREDGEAEGCTFRVIPLTCY